MSNNTGRRRRGGITSNTEYKKQPLKVNDNTVPTVLQGAQGCANLVAIHNMVAMMYGSKFGEPGTETEKFIKALLQASVTAKIGEVSDIPNAEKNGAKMAIASIRTESLQPRLGGHIDFVPTGLTLFCKLLDLPLLHCWVLDPEDSSYDILKDFCHSQVVDHYQAGSDQVTCERLLEESKSQLTSYGFRSLANEITDKGSGLIFCRNRLDVIHKHNGALLIYVADQAIREQMPEAVWMLFEEHQDENIYLTDLYRPVRNQPHKEKALKWYKEYLVNVVKDQEAKKDKGESSAAVPVIAEPASEEPVLGEPASEEPVLGEPASEEPVLDEPASEEPVLDEPAPAKPAPSPAPAEQSEETKEPAPAGPVLDEPASEEPVLDELAAAEPVQSEGTKEPALAKPAPVKPSEGTEGESSEQSEGSGTQPVGSLHTDVMLQRDGGSASSHPQAQSVDEACSVSSFESSATTSNDAEVKPEDNSVPEGDGADFLEFLNKFQDKGCSTTTYYFEGTVAAFALQKPQFYVPYEFIMAFNEPLALKIQDNYSGIYEDLRKAVVFYLSMKGVKFSDAVLKILGLPAAKSVQLFLDFLDTIRLHENYSIHEESSQSLPSYDSRRMALGYLDCLVVKFKSGRCWAGKWDEANMKVLNGSKFVIDLHEDCELDADCGFLHLNRFCETVLNRLKVNGKFPPYFDELAEDHMLINECFGKPDKWNRFLQLISNPLALKPPLVRAAFICNVYIAGDAKSSGDPPAYSPLSSRQNCVDWRTQAINHPLLKDVYKRRDREKKFKYIIDIWAPKHWHVFKFSRHFIHHVLGYTKGVDLIQKIKDISVVDILLARTICKAIASSFRFLVLNCGVEGLFSSAWRHYVGSDYADKPNEEDTTSNEMVQELLDNISEQTRSGYVYCEISVYSEPQHVSVIITNAELTGLEAFLKGINLTCVPIDDYLQCGSIKLWQRIHPANEASSERGVLVVEGPYSAEYDCICSIDRVSGLATHAVNIENADKANFEAWILTILNIYEMN